MMLQTTYLVKNPVYLTPKGTPVNGNNFKKNKNTTKKCNDMYLV